MLIKPSIRVRVRVRARVRVRVRPLLKPRPLCEGLNDVLGVLGLQ